MKWEVADAVTPPIVGLAVAIYSRFETVPDALHVTPPVVTVAVASRLVSIAFVKSP
jgi:hypothetical protein